MIRSFNYTRRQRIRRDDIDISFANKLDGKTLPVVRLGVNLSSYSLPGDAELFGEAYTRTEYQRFALGTVERPSVEPMNLAGFSTPGAVSFRLKVVDKRGVYGTILAEVDRLVPRLPDEDPARRDSLLHVRPAPLGEQVWQLSVDGETPVLLLSKSLPDWRSEARSTRFLALVYPAVVRQLLGEALADTGIDLEDDNNWRAKWIHFAQRQFGADTPPNPESSWDEKREWIDEVVERFCSRWEACSRYLTDVDPERKE